MVNALDRTVNLNIELIQSTNRDIQSRGPTYYFFMIGHLLFFDPTARGAR